MLCAQDQSALDESLKRLHDSQEMLHVHTERIRKYNNVIASGLSILERYAQGDLSLVFYVSSEGHGDIPGRLLMGASRKPIARDFSHVILRFDAADRAIKNCWNEQPMFISDIESVYGPDGKIPSLVGLYLGKHYVENATGGFIYADAANRSFKRILSRVDGELGLVSDRLGCKLGEDFDPRIIEGALEIVEAIPRDQSDVPNGSRVSNVMFDDFISNLRIDLNGSNVAFFQKSDSFIQPCNMLFGPFDLGPSVPK